jgi:hypothetical protein
MLLRLSRVVLLLAVVIVASTGQAATASQPGGESPVSGVAVTDVHYTLAAERPELIVGVSFAIAPSDVDQVQVRLHPEGQWSSCAVAGAQAECRLASPVPVAAATELSVSVS